MSDEIAGTSASTPVAPSSPSTTEGVVVSAPSAGQDAQPKTTEPLSIEAASKAFRDKLSQAERDTPIEIEDTSDDLDPNKGFEAPVLGADGRWRHKDGSFAPDPTKEPVAAEATPVDPEAPPTEAEPEPITVKLKGRNGEEKEVDVTDPELADLLRANANDGMRRQEFDRKSATLEAGFAELNAFKQMIQENPEEVVLAHMKPEAQARLAESLIATHWDALVEHILKLDADPSRRAVVAAETRIRTMQQGQRLQEIRSTSERASQIEQAVRTLIPESVDESTINQFMSDAGTDVARAIENGRAVTPENVKEILEPRVRLYRFNEAVGQTEGAVAGALTGTPKPARPAVALKQSAGQTGSVAAPVDPAKAAANAQRLNVARSISAAVAPSGAGAPAVRAPAVPKGATVEEASKHLRQTLGKSGWGQAA